MTLDQVLMVKNVGRRFAFPTYELTLFILMGKNLTLAVKTIDKLVLHWNQLYTPKKRQALSNRKKAISEFFFKSACPMLFFLCS